MMTETKYKFTGKLYDANLGIKEIAAKIRTILKNKYPELKFSVTIERFSMGQSMTIALMAAPFEVFDKSHATDKNGNVYGERGYQYAQLNQFIAIREYEDEGYNNGHYLTKKAHEVLNFATQMAYAYNFDDSDAMSDYSHNNYFFNLAVGRWDKPFVKE